MEGCLFFLALEMSEEGGGFCLKKEKWMCVLSVKVGS